MWMSGYIQLHIPDIIYVTVSRTIKILPIRTIPKFVFQCEEMLRKAPPWSFFWVSQKDARECENWSLKVIIPIILLHDDRYIVSTM